MFTVSKRTLSIFLAQGYICSEELAKCLICEPPSVLLREAVALADASLKGSERRSNQPRNSTRPGLRSSAEPLLQPLKCLSSKHTN